VSVQECWGLVEKWLEGETEVSSATCLHCKRILRDEVFEQRPPGWEAGLQLQHIYGVGWTYFLSANEVTTHFTCSGEKCEAAVLTGCDWENFLYSQKFDEESISVFSESWGWDARWHTWCKTHRSLPGKIEVSQMKACRRTVNRGIQTNEKQGNKRERGMEEAKK
jgi:hypothetical protein